jgi:hypothetical protein
MKKKMEHLRKRSAPCFAVHYDRCVCGGFWCVGVKIFFEIVLDKERILKSGMMLVEDSTRILKD